MANIRDAEQLGSVSTCKDFDTNLAQFRGQTAKYESICGENVRNKDFYPIWGMHPLHGMSDSKRVDQILV